MIGSVLPKGAALINPIRECLFDLLTNLERIGDDHEELFDSEVREQAGNVLMDLFVRQAIDCEIPVSLGMSNDQGNAVLRAAIMQFVDCATPICDAYGVAGFHDRLSLLQDNAVLTIAGNDYDDFIGHSPPDWYDADGNVLWDRVR